MTSRIDLPSPGLPTANRAAQRSAVLSAFLRTLYGPLDDGEVPGLDFDALSDSEPPLSASRTQLLAEPYLLRRILGPLILARPGRQDSSPEFRELVLAACRDLPPPGGRWRRDAPAASPTTERQSFEGALDRLRRWARKRYAFLPADASARGVRKALELFEPEDVLEVEPSHVRTANNVFTVSRTARVQAPLSAIADAINPLNWGAMGDFFEYVGQAGNSEKRADGWRGLFEERFVTGWGPLTVNSYRAFLNVDFTFDEARARADYSLAYEQDDQLEVDDGYLEAKTIPGRRGWCSYYAEKSTKFRSPQSNLLAPAILAVALESNLSSIEDAAYARLEA